MLVVGLTSVAMLAGGFVARTDLRAPLLVGGALSVVVALAASRALAFVDTLPTDGARPADGAPAAEAAREGSGALVAAAPVPGATALSDS